MKPKVLLTVASLLSLLLLTLHLADDVARGMFPIGIGILSSILSLRELWRLRSGQA